MSLNPASACFLGVTIAWLAPGLLFLCLLLCVASCLVAYLLFLPQLLLFPGPLGFHTVSFVLPCFLTEAHLYFTNRHNDYKKANALHAYHEKSHLSYYNLFSFALQMSFCTHDINLFLFEYCYEPLTFYRLRLFHFSKFWGSNCQLDQFGPLVCGPFSPLNINILPLTLLNVSLLSGTSRMFPFWFSCPKT